VQNNASEKLITRVHKLLLDENPELTKELRELWTMECIEIRRAVAGSGGVADFCTHLEIGLILCLHVSLEVSLTTKKKKWLRKAGPC
jgi:hypothetical protein